MSCCDCIASSSDPPFVLKEKVCSKNILQYSSSEHCISGGISWGVEATKRYRPLNLSSFGSLYIASLRTSTMMRSQVPVSLWNGTQVYVSWYLVIYYQFHLMRISRFPFRGLNFVWASHGVAVELIGGAIETSGGSRHIVDARSTATQLPSCPLNRSSRGPSKQISLKCPYPSFS